MAKKSREEIDHYTLDQYEQERYLSIGHERTKNLGHDWRESEIEQSPAGRMQDYDSADTSRTFRDPARLQGVYRKCSDPRSGISSGENLNKWADYAEANSYTGRGNKAGVGTPPSMPDPRTGRGSNESDGYLADQPSPSTKNWADFRAGSESGEGRLEKLHNKR
jgi:hypothetical protein